MATLFLSVTARDLGNELLIILLASLDAAGQQLETGAAAIAAGVAYESAAWAGRELSSSEIKRWSRAAEDLERRQLLSRHRPAGRTTHLRPTPAGIRQALALAGPRADRASIRRALRATAWATPAHWRAAR